MDAVLSRGSGLLGLAVRPSPGIRLSADVVHRVRWNIDSCGRQLRDMFASTTRLDRCCMDHLFDVFAVSEIGFLCRGPTRDVLKNEQFGRKKKPTERNVSQTGLMCNAHDWLPLRRQHLLHVVCFGTLQWVVVEGLGTKGAKNKCLVFLFEVSTNCFFVILCNREKRPTAGIRHNTRLENQRPTTACKTSSLEPGRPPVVTDLVSQCLFCTHAAAITDNFGNQLLPFPIKAELWELRKGEEAHGEPTPLLVDMDVHQVAACDSRMHHATSHMAPGEELWKLSTVQHTVVTSHVSLAQSTSRHGPFLLRPHNLAIHH